MTTHQEAHLHAITKRATKETDEKYRKGQAEHGGNLFEKGILFAARNAREEAIDQLTYTDGLMQELPKLKAKLEAIHVRIEATSGDDILLKLLTEAFDLLDGKPNT